LHTSNLGTGIQGSKASTHVRLNEQLKAREKTTILKEKNFDKKRIDASYDNRHHKHYRVLS